MDRQGNGLVGIGKPVIGAEGNEDIVADALHVNDHTSGVFGGETAGQRGDHPAAATFSIIASGMSKFACTFCTSSWSSRVSTSLSACSAVFSSSWM